MQSLNFPSFKFRFKSNENKLFIFDIIRKKFVVLNPEEWVRQHVVHFLINEIEIPKALISVEKKITINNMSKRYDVVVFNSTKKIHLLVECKAPNITICQETFNQIARYNLELDAKYLMVTNGLHHYYCTINYTEKQYQFIKTLPKFN